MFLLLNVKMAALEICFFLKKIKLNKESFVIREKR